MSGGMRRMDSPLCLIENGADGKLRVVPEARDVLLMVEQHVVVVAVVGLYRTGKSYLMNKLAGSRTGFALGSTIQSKTKGIWMWCVPHPRKPDHTLLLLDTEGLGDVEKGDEKNDMWIFSLAVLLSSTLVYNSKGVIDNDALQRLHYVTELTEHIKVKSGAVEEEEDESTEFARVFPSFVWAVRDFTLQLEHDGKPITSDEYLNIALRLRKGHSKDTHIYNMPRSCLRNYFPTRKCFMFEPPASTENMQRMEELDDCELKQAFVQQTHKFCQYIYSSSETKCLQGGTRVTGRLLSGLAETYVQAINNKQIPCLENAVVALAEIENHRAMTEALAYYQSEMAQCLVFPTKTLEELSHTHATVEKKAIKVFIDRSFKDDEQQYQLELMQRLQSEYETLCARNAEESKKKCRSIIQDAFQPLESNLKSGTYMTSGGYRKFSETLQECVKQYRAKEGKGVKAEETLKEYLVEKEAIGESILKADKSISAAQQKIEAEKAKARAAEQDTLAQKEALAMLQRQLLDQEKTYQENVEQLLKKMEEDRKMAAEENEKVLTAKLQEQQNLLNENFKERAQLLQEEIAELRVRSQAQQERSPSMFSSILDTIGQGAALVLPGIIPRMAGIGLSAISRIFR